jgi:hypothetical protein
MTCTKCGRPGMDGPRFAAKSTPFGNQESLRYRCGKCGWEKDEPCLDAKEPGGEK